MLSILFYWFSISALEKHELKKEEENGNEANKDCHIFH